MIRNEKFIEKAMALEPDLIKSEIHPQSIKIVKIEESNGGEQNRDFLSTGDRVIIDFGNHYTGYISMHIDSLGHHPDAPVWVRISFAERLCEFDENAEEYQGWISKGWIQQEQLHIDIIPGDISLTRRYAFRYIAIDILDCSKRFQIRFSDIKGIAVSSADDARLEPYKYGKEIDILEDAEKNLILEMERVGTRTLHECMQSVFEDGPKRDRRLWMGDLRLQAMVNYETFQQNDLVKRCLYMFAGNRMDNGEIASNIFLTPIVEGDDQAMLDYALFFIPTLLEYVKQTQDMGTLKDLYPIAMDQVHIMDRYFDEDNLIQDIGEMGWIFVDWNLNLNRQASGQGICLYALKAAIELARICGDEPMLNTMQQSYERKRQAAREYLFDKGLGVFISGNTRQISWASQCWMIIGGAVDEKEGREILHKIQSADKEMELKIEEMVTPYMYHHYIEALIMCGEKGQALKVMEQYWGGMIKEGADTFWELYNPSNPEESPYGGTIVNSYCHAWSCAPAYFLRKYF